MTSNLSTHGLHDAAQMGMRTAIGVIFIVHGFGKFGNPGFGGWISSMGIPAEMQIPIALAEFIPGILLVIGVLTRISASLISIVMLGAIFLDSIYDIRDFYKKCGFTEIGSVFERVGLPHIRMEMSI